MPSFAWESGGLHLFILVFNFFDKSLLYCVCGGEGEPVYHRVCGEQGISCGSQFSPPTLWIPRIKSRSSGWEATAATHEPSPLPLFTFCAWLYRVFHLNHGAKWILVIEPRTSALDAFQGGSPPSLLPS